MRIIGVAMARNEADVVEAFVRHNLAVLDHLVVIEHGSGDATAAILAALVAEGLPLTMLADASPGFDQATLMTRAVRDAMRRHDADWCFALDADEFIAAPSRDALVASLAAHDTPVYAVPWTVYVPGDAIPDDPHPLRRATHRVDAPPVHAKAVVSRAFATDDAMRLSQGNHWLVDAAGRDVRPVPLAGVTLAHVPFRAVGQLVAKAVLGWLGYRIATGPRALDERINWHWRVLSEEYLAGRILDVATVRQFVIRAYAMPLTAPDDAPLPRLVDDPLRCPFALRYLDAARSDPMRLVAQWATRFVDSVQGMR